MQKKRLLFFIVCVVLCIQFSAVSAQNGDVVGTARYTDIVAYVNNRPIASYNVNGYTVIVAEELVHYGFLVEWNESDRFLWIVRNPEAETIEGMSGVCSYGQHDGLKYADILETDIRTYVNGNQVTGFNIGGQTMIYLNSLTCVGVVKWNAEDRAAELVLGGISMIEKPPVYEGEIPYEVDPYRPMVALTFDDGPFPYTTERILDTLQYYNSRATFYVVGSNVRAYPEIAKRLGEQNMQIGSHTFNHIKLTEASDGVIAEEIIATDQATREVIGVGTSTMRPPYWVSNERVRRVAGLPVVTWSVDTLDWQNKNADVIFDTVVNNVRDGDIVLMHDTMNCTADAVARMVPALIDAGFQLVTVEEMAAARGWTLEPGVLYSKIY